MACRAQSHFGRAHRLQSSPFQYCCISLNQDTEGHFPEGRRGLCCHTCAHLKSSFYEHFCNLSSSCNCFSDVTGLIPLTWSIHLEWITRFDFSVFSPHISISPISLFNNLPERCQAIPTVTRTDFKYLTSLITSLIFYLFILTLF